MIIKYQKQTDEYTTHTLVTPEDSGCTELATISGDTYVHVPDGVTLPDQPEQITVEDVTLTDDLREQIKAASPHVQLSYKRLSERIRQKYDADAEWFFARITIGYLAKLIATRMADRLTEDELASISGWAKYELKDDEPGLLAQYQADMEEQREIARQERASWGL